MMGKDEAAPPLMTVRQLAQQGDVTVHVVRNYLRRGLLQAATHTEGGYQLFSASDLQRLHFIRAAQPLGFTLAEIEERSEERRVGKAGGSKCWAQWEPDHETKKTIK